MITKYVIANEDGSLVYTELSTYTQQQMLLSGAGIGSSINNSRYVRVFDSMEKAVEAARELSKNSTKPLYVCKVIPTHLIKPAQPGDVVELSVNSAGPYR